MDSALHCNTLACRALVQDRAVVTTCCHIFCLQCADKLELSTGKDGQRKCPACLTVLNNPDDAVIAQLNPSEDYKTSVLSGLNPSTIMECAGRGLSFWNYQMSQEILYQEYLARSLTDKYTSLNSHLDKTIAEANQEIKKLQGKLESACDEHRKLDSKYRLLHVAHQERGKAFSQIQTLYQKLKQQQLSAGMELAAEHQAAEYISHGAGNVAHPDRASLRGVAQFLHSRGSGGGDSRRGRQEWPVHPRLHEGIRAIQDTPSVNRTRIPVQSNPNFPHAAENYSARDESRPSYDAFHRTTPSARAPPGLGHNKPGHNLHGFGLSAGVKVGSPQLINPPYGHSGISGGRPPAGR